jgi:hypothetical protein
MIQSIGLSRWENFSKRRQRMDTAIRATDSPPALVVPPIRKRMRVHTESPPVTAHASGSVLYVRKYICICVYVSVYVSICMYVCM